MARYFTTYYPAIIAAVFLVFIWRTTMPGKGRFVVRALVALVIAVILAHLNRNLEFWPAHLYFPSGHTAFCLGVSWSLAMLRPWTLIFTLPLLVAMAVGLVVLRFHTPIEVLGSFPLVLVVYGIIHAWWRLPGDFAPLDRARVSS